MALREYLRSRALGAKSIPSDQGCWIAIVHTYWPLPGYLHCDDESLVCVECSYSEYIRRWLKSSPKIE